MYLFLQNSHSYGFSPEWIILWFVNCDCILKDASHWSHLNCLSLSLKCTSMCFLKNDWVGYFLWHVEHSNLLVERSVWFIFTCILKLDWSPKPLPHSSQTYGFSPVWRRLCLIRTCLNLNSLPHSSHLKRRFSLADRGWLWLVLRGPWIDDFLGGGGAGAVNWVVSMFSWLLGLFVSYGGKWSDNWNVSTTILFAMFSTWLKKEISLE